MNLEIDDKEREAIVSAICGRIQMVINMIKVSKATEPSNFLIMSYIEEFTLLSGLLKKLRSD